MHDIGAWWRPSTVQLLLPFVVAVLHLSEVLWWHVTATIAETRFSLFFFLPCVMTCSWSLLNTQTVRCRTWRTCMLLHPIVIQHPYHSTCVVDGCYDICMVWRSYLLAKQRTVVIALCVPCAHFVAFVCTLFSVTRQMSTRNQSFDDHDVDNDSSLLLMMMMLVQTTCLSMLCSHNSEGQPRVMWTTEHDRPKTQNWWPSPENAYNAAILLRRSCRHRDIFS